MCANDTQREVRVFQVSKTFDKMYFTVEGFDSFDTSDEKNNSIEGKIKLVLKNGVDKKEYILADCKLKFPGIAKFRKLVYPFQKPQEVEVLVRQGMANIFFAKLSDCYMVEDDKSDNTRQPTSNVASIKSRGYQENQEHEKKRYRKNMMLACVGIPLVIFSLGGLAKLLFFTPKTSPVEQAVLKAMEADPSSMASQVELTKQTLKQMGLDPGKGGDIGCLAP